MKLRAAESLVEVNAIAFEMTFAEVILRDEFRVTCVTRGGDDLRDNVSEGEISSDKIRIGICVFLLTLPCKKSILSVVASCM